MKSMNISKKGMIAAIGCALVLPLLSLPTTLAAIGIETTESTGKTCSITLTDGAGDAFKDLTAVDIPVDIYKIATVDVSGNFTLISDYSTLTLPDQNADSAEIDASWQETARAAADIAVENSLTAAAHTTIGAGKSTVSVGNLATGLYLIVPETVTGSGAEYEYSFAPSLVSLPNNDYYNSGNDTWIYDVAITLKPEQTNLPGRLIITKTLDEINTSMGDVMFVFKVEATKTVAGAKTTVYSNVEALTFTATSGGTQQLVIADLPAGAQVTVTEVYSGGSYELSPGVQKTQTATILSDRAVEMGLGTTAQVDYFNTFNEKLVPGDGIVNHFDYNEEAGEWKWTQETDTKTSANANSGADTNTETNAD